MDSQNIHQQAIIIFASFIRTPINGISKLTKLFPAGKTQEIVSNLLNIKTKEKRQ
jgi:hypothetical protein